MFWLKTENDSTAPHTLISLNIPTNLDLIKQWGTLLSAIACVTALFVKTIRKCQSAVNTVSF